MLTDEQLDFFGEALTDVFQQLENDIISDIARRVRKTQRWTETAELQAEAMRELGWSPYKIRLEVFKKLNADPEYRKAIDENTLAHKAKQQEAIDAAIAELKDRCPDIFEEVGNMSFRNDLSLWAEAGKTLVRGSAVDKLVREMTKRAEGDLINLTRSLGFRMPDGSLVAKQKAYTQAMNRALTQTVTGTMSAREACTRAVRELARSGLRKVDYASGKSWQLDTAAMNSIRTSAAQLAGDIMQTNIEESGVEYVQVSEHWGARPSHAEWQGGIYHVEQFKAICGYGDPGDPDHIYSYNCRHHHYPFWPGISEKLEYPPEPGPFEIDGKKYTYYEATQKQRKMEREIRALKREALAQEAAGDNAGMAASTRKMQEIRKEYYQFSKATNLRSKLERTTVFGYDKEAAGKGRKELNFQDFFNSVSISQPKRSHSSERVSYVQSVQAKAAELSVTDKQILAKISKRFEWVEVPTETADIYTLAALTAETGDEFAMFAKGDTKIILHGASANGIAWRLPEDLARRVYNEQLRWTGHSHPTTENLMPSVEDRITLRMFTWQKKSSIVDLNGTVISFTSNMFDDLYR